MLKIKLLIIDLFYVPSIRDVLEALDPPEKRAIIFYLKNSNVKHLDLQYNMEYAKAELSPKIAAKDFNKAEWYTNCFLKQTTR